jgi:tRNA(adenine34) deaminase
VRSDDERWMRVALQEAALAPEHGDVPVGAVVVGPEGELARDHNRREVDADPTAHAELLALRTAAAARGTWRVDGATVYVTLEPCVMCAGALVLARVSRLVIGADDPKAGAVGALWDIPRDPRLNHRVAVTRGVCAEASAAILRSFFRERRTGQRHR